jgi:hypothetical protein
MNKSILIAGLSFVTLFSFGQTPILNESFSNGIPSTWNISIQDTNTVNPAVAEFSPGWISLVDPENTADTIVGSTSYFLTENKASRWLITPPLSLGGYGNTLTWNARVHDPSFPDSYMILVSTTDNQPQSFTDTLYVLVEELENWTTRSITLNDSNLLNQQIHLAFVNNSVNKFKLYLDDIQVTVEDAAAINEVEKIAFSVFPNPSSDVIYVTGNKAIQSLSLVSTTGQLLQTVKNSNSIQLVDFPAGTYFVVVSTATQQVTKRIVKK